MHVLAAPPPQESDVQAKAHALIKEGLALYNQGELQRALEKFRAALPLFRDSSDQLGEATALGDIGAVYVAMGQGQQALPYLEEALAIQRQVGDQAGEGVTLGTLGTVYYNLAQYEEALDTYKQALTIIEAGSNRANEATVLAAIGAVYAAEGQSRQALDYYQQALNIQEQIQDRNGEASTLSEIGTVYLDTGRLAEALAHLEQALAIQRHIDDRPGEAFTLSKIGAAHAAMGQPQLALDCYQQALTIQEQVGSQLGEAAILGRIAAVYENTGQLQQARTYFERALTLQRQIGDRAGEKETLAGLGTVYHGLGQLEKALDYYQQSLGIATAIGDQAGEGEILNIIGAVYAAMGQAQQALDYYRQALDLQRQVGDRLSEATTLNNMGAACHILSDYPQALDYLQQALAVQREVGDRPGEAGTLVNVGTIYYELGQPQEALARFQQALPIFRQIGNRSGEANALGHIGGAYQEILGQLPRAQDYYQQALKIYQEIGARQGEAQQLNNIGYAYEHLDQLEQALEYFQQALTILREVGDKWGQAVALDNIGGIYSRKGYPQQAMTYYQEALSLRRAIADRAGEATTLNNIGTAHLALGQSEQALVYLQQALPIAQDIGDRRGEATILDNIGISYLNRNQQAEALTYFTKSIEIIESVRSGMSIEELKSGFAGRHAGSYESVVSLLVTMDRPEEAFAYSEHARARAFLDQLGNVRVDPSQGANPVLVEDEQRLVGEIADLNRRVQELTRQPTDPQSSGLLTSLEMRLTSKRAEYADLLIQLKLSNPAYASLINVDPLTLRQIQTKVLSSNITLVSYFVTDEQTIAFVVGQDSFAAVPIAVTRQDLAKRVATFRSLMALEAERPTDQLTQDRRAAAQALYALLLAPLSTYLPTTPESPNALRPPFPSLIIVPHDTLHYLPFAALLDDQGIPLSTRFTFSLAPSASTLAYAQANQNPDAGRLVALGNPASDLPPLPYAQREVEALSELYPLHTILIGRDATEGALRAKVADADWLHLAAHAELSPSSPLFSAIHLAAKPEERGMGEKPAPADDDGRLEVREVFNLNLAGVNGVVLSACETGLGEQSRGDELVGLTRAFLYAGTPMVVASLWSVEDEATAALMTAFHRHLRTGLGPAAALRVAQEEVRQNPHWSAPYYWAGFQVIGDGGPSVEPASRAEAVTQTPVPGTAGSDDVGRARLRISVAGLLAMLGLVIWVVWHRRGKRPI